MGQQVAWRAAVDDSERAMSVVLPLASCLAIGVATATRLPVGAVLTDYLYFNVPVPHCPVRVLLARKPAPGRTVLFEFCLPGSLHMERFLLASGPTFNALVP